MKKLYPSSLSFAIGRTSFSDKPSGCFRRILLQANGYREGEIPEYYKEIGNEWEQEIERRLADFPGGYQREVPIKRDGRIVQISGRSDFILEHAVVEAKATSSKTAKTRILKNSEYDLNHLAQLCFYMWALNLNRGFLHYRVYKYGTKEILGEREFFVMFDYDAGGIWVDGKDTHLTKHDLLQFIRVAEEVIDTTEVGPRPIGALQKDFFSACSYCSVKQICDRFDSGEIQDGQSFIDSAKSVLVGNSLKTELLKGLKA